MEDYGTAHDISENIMQADRSLSPQTEKKKEKNMGTYPS